MMSDAPMSTALQPLSVAQLLHAWEAGVVQPPARRTLPVLMAALPALAEPQVLGLRLGQRNQCLLTLRTWVFGSRLCALADCPQCKAVIDLTLDTSDLCHALPDTSDVPTTLQHGAWRIHFTSPRVADLLSASRFSDMPRIRQYLIECCVISIHHDEMPQPVAAIPADVLAEVIAAIEAADPLAHLDLSLSCPDCAHAWAAGFDIASFLWGELDAWAWRTLREVDVLARVYGWSEADILSLSATRRQRYLELAETNVAEAI